MIFLSYSKRQRGGAGTALASATLSQDGSALQNLRDIFVMAPGLFRGQGISGRVSSKARTAPFT